MLARAIINREALDLESLTSLNHLIQMKMWMVAQGVELLVTQDTPDHIRLKFIKRVWKDNKLDLFLEGIAELFIVTGGILWTVIPTKTSYQIYWWHSGKENNKSLDVPSQYRVYYSPTDPLAIEEVVIRYSYEEVNFNQKLTKWVRIRMKKEAITKEIFAGMPSLDLNDTNTFAAEKRIQYQNSFGFIPAWESPNKPYIKGDSGRSDFDLLRHHIDVDDQMARAINDNLITFGNPVLITTRESDEVLKRYNLMTGRNAPNYPGGWAETNGFGQSANPWSNPKKKHGSIPPVIGGVQPDERFVFITPDPVSPDQTRQSDAYRSGLHSALGGIDPLDTSFSTFGEVKTLHGKVAVTAKNKCLSLWKNGLCRLFEDLIRFEEDLFMLSFRYWVGQQDKNADLTTITKEIATQLIYDQGVQLPFKVGLVPYGYIEVNWRHNGPVFEDSPQDKQTKSIMVRNLQELGVGSLEALDELFPDLSEEEKRRKLTGVPFRIISQCTGAIQQLLNIQNMMIQFPDDEDPSLSLASTTNITKIVKRILQTLERELNYGREFIADNESVSTPTTPATAGSTTTDSSPADSATTIPVDWSNIPTTPGTSVRNSTFGVGGFNADSTTLRPAPAVPTFIPYTITPPRPESNPLPTSQGTTPQSPRNKTRRK